MARFLRLTRLFRDNWMILVGIYNYTLLKYICSCFEQILFFVFVLVGGVANTKNFPHFEFLPLFLH